MLPTTARLTPAAEASGPFVNPPGRYVLDEFREWVKTTGRPDEWRFHDRSQPPPNQDFQQVLAFQVPDSLRAAAGMASCPICSPTHPKYFDGALAWFPVEGVLRAIGNECAKSHFGAERANAAVALGKLTAAVESAQDFLLETLPQVALLRTEADHLELLASDVDRLRQLVWKASSKAACERLGKLGSSGSLSVEVARQVDGVGLYGEVKSRTDISTVATYPVVGLRFLTRRFAVLGTARSTVQALGLLRSATPDEALEFIVGELKVHDHLFEAERLARTAVEALTSVRDAVGDARAFFSASNLSALAAWSRDPRGHAPIQFDFDARYPARLRVRGAKRLWKEISISPRILAKTAEDSS